MKIVRNMIMALALLSNTAFVMMASAAVVHSEDSSIHWQTNYDDAVKMAEAKKVPLILFFTGSDWCTWCTRLEQEALDTKEFAKRTADKFVFVKLDFPVNHPGDPRLASQNQQLKKKYGVTGFPSLIIVDTQGNRIGATGYRPGGAIAYAEHLLGIISSYQKHRSTLQELGSQNGQSIDDASATFDGLKERYMQARQSGNTQQALAILEQGLKVDQGGFFLLEQYRNLIENGGINDKEAIRLRDRILSLQPDNAVIANRDIAIIEFQTLQQQTKKQHLEAAAIVTPLVHYTEKFATKDPDIWRVQMQISQVFMESNKPKEALHYAQDAQKAAPADVKPEIEKAIQYIKTRE